MLKLILFSLYSIILCFASSVSAQPCSTYEYATNPVKCAALGVAITSIETNITDPAKRATAIANARKAIIQEASLPLPGSWFQAVAAKLPGCKKLEAESELSQPQAATDEWWQSRCACTGNLEHIDKAMSKPLGLNSQQLVQSQPRQGSMLGKEFTFQGVNQSGHLYYAVTGKASGKTVTVSTQICRSQNQVQAFVSWYGVIIPFDVGAAGNLLRAGSSIHLEPDRVSIGPQGVTLLPANR